MTEPQRKHVTFYMWCHTLAVSIQKQVGAARIIFKTCTAAGWVDERCLRPLFCTIKAELGWGQPGLMRWSWDETLPQCSIDRSTLHTAAHHTTSELAAAPCTAVGHTDKILKSIHWPISDLPRKFHSNPFITFGVKLLQTNTQTNKQDKPMPAKTEPPTLVEVIIYVQLDSISYKLSFDVDTWFYS